MRYISVHTPANPDMMDAAPPNRNPRRSPPLDFREDDGDILASCPAFGNAEDEAVVTDADDAPRNKATIVEGANVSLWRAMSSTPTVRKMRDPHCLRVSYFGLGLVPSPQMTKVLLWSSVDWDSRTRWGTRTRMKRRYCKVD